MSRMVTLALVLYLSPLASQQFIRSYSYRPSTGDIAQHVTTVDSNIFIHIASVLDTPFTHVEGGMAKLDWTGEEVWNNVWNFDFGYVGISFANGIVATSDTVYGTGNYRNLETEEGTFSPAIVANSVESGATRPIRFPYDYRASIHDVFLNPDSSFTVVSENWVSDSFDFPIVIENIDLAERSLSSEEYLAEFAVTNATNTARDSRGNLYVAHIGCFGSSANCYPFQGWLSKINADGSFGWSRSYGFTANNQPVRPEVAIPNDTTIAFAWTRDTNNLDIQESPPIIYYLDTLGNKRDSFAFHGTYRSVYRLIACENGDVIGVGLAWSRLRRSGWMFRLDGNANLVWERYIQDHRQTVGTETELQAVTEAADGSIVAAGSIFHGFPPDDGGSSQRAWVVKLDAAGCYESGCSSDTIYLEYTSSIDELEVTERTAIKIWPNPATDHLDWSVTDQVALNRITDYQILNASGYTVQSGSIPSVEQLIPIANLPAGLYYLTFLTGNRTSVVGKFIKR